MSTWLWINILLGAVFFGATAGIPLWMVLRHPDADPGNARPATVARPRPSTARPQRRPEVQHSH
jgi:hypothetical protein